MQIIFCYVDPATAAIVWQVLAGVAITLGVVLGVWWKKISTFFKGAWTKLFRKKKANTSEENEDELSTELEDVVKSDENQG